MNKIRLGNKDIYYQVFYKKIKHMYLRVKDNSVVITCNRHVSITQVEEFIQKNCSKILNTLEKHQNKQPLYNKNTMMIFSKSYRLYYFCNAKRNHYQMESDSISIWFKNADFDTKYLESIYKDLTIKEMQQAYKDVYEIISKEIDIDDIIFKTQLMKSRYGSCIPKKRIIKLNSILARFDKTYIKTILIHELIHLSVKNHQKEFYKYIDKYIPNYRTIIRTLNNETRKYVM